MNKAVKCLLPNKTIQHVNQHLRREAGKPLDMSATQHIMHICRMNTEEIPRCPLAFNDTQRLSDNEIVDILLFGAPKSWQREMDCQGIDPLTTTPTEAVEFMERIEMSEDFDANKKAVATTTKKGGKKKANGRGNSDANGSKHCVLHGNNNTHGTSECKTLMAQAKKLKGNNGANQKGKDTNKPLKNKAKDNTGDSKKELAALVKKATQLIKKGELDTVDLTKKVWPVKKRKVKWPSKEEEQEQELCALDVVLKNFNHEDLDEMENWMSPCQMKQPMKSLSEWQVRIRKEAQTLLQQQKIN